MKIVLKKSKKVFVIISFVIILVVTLLFMAYITMIDVMNITNSAMSSSLSTLQNKAARSINIEELASDIDSEIVNSSIYVVDKVFKEVSDAEQALDMLENDKLHLYLVDDSNNILKSKNANEFNLSTAQMNDLMTNRTLGVVENGNMTYYGCIDVSYGKLIIHYLESMELSWESLVTGMSKRFTYYAAYRSDGSIFYSSDETLIGIKAPEKLSTSVLGIEKNFKSKLNDCEYGFFDINNKSYYCMQSNFDDYIFGINCNVDNIIMNIIEEMITPIVVLTGLFAIILIFFFTLWKDIDKSEKKWIRVLHTDHYFELSLTKHLSCFVLFIAIIVFIFNMHYMNFSVYSQQSSMAYQNLDILSENIKASKKDKDYIVNIIKKSFVPISDYLAKFFVVNDSLLNNDFLKEFANNCYISEISVYDDAGYTVATSGDYGGYKLTQNENDSMYEAWDILTSDKEYIFKEMTENAGTYILARKRKDNPGIICLKYNNKKFSDMLEYYSKEEAIRGTDFGNATTFFVKINDDSKIYEIKPYSTTITAANIIMPKELFKDNYSGIVKIADNNSYVATKISEDIIVTSSINCDDLDDILFFYNIFLLFTFVLLMIVLFIGCICKPATIEIDENIEMQSTPMINNREKTSLLADNTFRKMIKYVFIVLIIGYCIMMFKKTADGRTLLSYIFNGKWDKGINLFSINASVIVAATVLIVVLIIDKLLSLIGDSIGPKGNTICSIAISLLKFIGLFYVILHALYQFGVNTSALIASAGLASMIIGLAAKDTLADLISGLFLIFEGNIKVGDLIKYKDFTGTVTEMGARVTVIKKFNNKLIVNNSDLKQYNRLSDELSCAWVEIIVGPNEDLEKIKNLIKSNGEWYMSKIPTLKSEPGFANISHVDALGITICITGSCLEISNAATKRAILINTIELFRENGIIFGRTLYK